MKKILTAFLLFIFTAPAMALIVEGSIVDSQGPFIGAAIIEAGTQNGNASNEDGYFYIIVDDPNAILEISSIGYETQRIRASEVRKDVPIVLVESYETLDEVVTVGSVCKGNETTLTSLHALDAELMDTGKTKYVNGRQVKQQICIPTQCQQEYLLQNSGTLKATCKKCTELISNSATAHADGGRCILDTCESAYMVQNGSCTKCTSIIPNSATAHAVNGSCVVDTCKKGFVKSDTACTPCEMAEFAKEMKVENNHCVIDKCETNFTNVGGLCLVDCNKFKSKLNATGVARKSTQPTALRADNDYSEFCYATACDGTRFVKSGDGEEATCISVSGSDCTSEIANAQHAHRNDKGKCILDSCVDWFKANKTTNKCEDQHDKPCPDSFMRSKYPDAQSAKISEFKDNQATKCDIKQCKDRTKTPSDDGQSCVAVCSLGEQARLEAAGAAETTTKKGVCIAKSCKCGYTLNDGACIKWNGNNEPCGKLLPHNASSGYMACSPNTENGTPYCRITACKNSSYKIVNEGTKDNSCASSAGDVCNAYNAGDVFAVNADDSGELKRSGTQVKCVSTKCINHFKIVNNKCTLDCSSYLDDDENYHKFIGASALKQTSGILPQGRDDYSAYCYPTSCKTPKYVLRGNGESATCENTTGDNCESQIQHATEAYYDDNHKCILEKCDEANGYTADTESNKCVDRVARRDQCDTKDWKEIDHATGGTYERKNGKFVCHPTCDTNFTAKWVNTWYICEMISRTGACTDEEFNRIKSSNHSGYNFEHAVGGDIVTRDANGDVTLCNITRCDTGYVPTKDNTSCTERNCKCEQKWSDSEGKCIDLSDEDKVCKTRATAITPALPTNASAATRTCDSETAQPYCKVTACKDASFKISDDGKSCVSVRGEACTPTDTTNASEEGITEIRNGKAICKPLSCKYDTYVVKLNSAGTDYQCVLDTSKDRTGKKCTDAELINTRHDANATEGTVSAWDNQNGTVTDCSITKCKTNYEPSSDHKSCVPIDKSGQRCTQQQLRAQDAHATSGIVKYQNENDGKVSRCEITKCQNGYEPAKSNSDAPYNDICIENKCRVCGEEWDAAQQKCVPWKDKNCTANSNPKLPANASKATKDCDNGKPVCKITECASNYTLNRTKNTCVYNKGQECTHEDPNVAVASLHRVNGGLVCQIDACNTGYQLNKSKTACVKRDIPTGEEVKELKANAAKAKENEKSLVNRTIGAAGIGTVGIGGMMVGSALSEQAADTDAEGAMRAYLNTFACEYGSNQRVSGGTTGVEIPGGNDMFNLYTQYATLANDLKIRKEALGIKPGIESEVVIDKAETNLYDDVGTGITGGNYASVARALTNPTGEDAKRWNEQKEKTASNLKTGAITAGAGAAASLAANLAVNTRKDKQDKTDEILSKYANNKTTFGEKTNTQSAIVNTLSEVTDVSSTVIDTSDVVVNGQVGSLYTAQNDEITVANDETPVIEEETIQCDSTKPLSNDDLSALREVVGTRTGALPFISGIQQDATTSDSQRRKLAELKQLCESKNGTWVEQTNKFNEWYAARRSYANTCIDTSTAQVVNETYQCDDNCKACWEEEYTKYSNYLKSKGLCGTFKTYTCKFAQPDTIASTRCQRIFKNKTGSDIYWTQTMSSDERWKTTSQYKLTDNWGPRNDTDVANNFDACRIYSSSN